MNITQEKVKEISKRHMHAIDKMYRMWAGLSSKLLSYEEGTLVLQVHHSARWPKDPVTTAKQLAQSWMNHNPELKEAYTYIVYVHKMDQETGFVTSTAGKDTKALIKNMADAIAALSKETQPDRIGELIIGTFYD